MAWAERHGKGWRARWQGPPGSEPPYPSKAGFPTKSAAKRYGEDQEAAVRAGTYIDPHLSKTPLGDWWVKWFAAQDLRPNTMKAYTQQWRRHIAPRWERTALSEIRGIDLQAWVKELREKQGLSASSVNIITSALSGCLESAVFNKLLGSSPMPPKASRARKSNAAAPRPGVVIPLPVAEQILSRLPGDADRLFVLLALMTGMRWSELAAMRVSDLHLPGPDEAGYYRIDPQIGALHRDEHWRPYFGPPKSGDTGALAPGYKPGRIIDLPPVLVAILLAYLETLPGTRDGLLFPNRFGLPLRYETWNSERWRPACDGRPAYVSPKGRSVREAIPAAWPGLKFHDTKHTAATILDNNHTHPAMRNYRLGHVTPGAPGIYSHPTREMRAELVDGLERFLCSWLEGGLCSAWPTCQRPRSTPISLPPARKTGSGDNALF